MVQNEKVSSWLTKLLFLVIIVAIYFGATVLPPVIDWLHVRQEAITAFSQREMPNFDEKHKAIIISKMITNIQKETGLEFEPGEIDFKTSANENYIAIDYEVDAKFPFIDKYLTIPFSIYIEQ